MSATFALSGIVGALVAVAVMVVEAAVRKRAAKRAAERRAAARRASKQIDDAQSDGGAVVNRKKIDTSKKLAGWCVAMATVSEVMPYVLALMDKNPVSETTQIVFPACIGYLITYAGKSLGEKLSRNSHGLDENGRPFDLP